MIRVRVILFIIKLNFIYCKNFLSKISKETLIKTLAGASLVAQWLRIHLPMQATWVQALVWEDPTCCRATKSVHHNYWACALEPVSHNYWACALEPVSHSYWSLHAYSLCSATREATTMRSPHTSTKSIPCLPQLEKARAQRRRPNAAINK